MIVQLSDRFMREFIKHLSMLAHLSTVCYIRFEIKDEDATQATEISPLKPVSTPKLNQGNI